MLIWPGKCVKSGKDIWKNGRPLRNWNQVSFKLSDGSLFDIAIDQGENIESSDWDGIINAFNEYEKINGGNGFKEGVEIVEQVDRFGFSDYVWRSQGGRCYSCHKPIEDKWIIINEGVMLHEKCNMPRPQPVEKRAKDPSKIRRKR